MMQPEMVFAEAVASGAQLVSVREMAEHLRLTPRALRQRIRRNPEMLAITRMGGQLRIVVPVARTG